jgi:hypothetical protein
MLPPDGHQGRICAPTACPMPRPPPNRAGGRQGEAQPDRGRGRRAEPRARPSARARPVRGAQAKVVAEITAEGLAVMTPTTRDNSWALPPPPRSLVPLVEAKPIMQPFGDRSKVVIEPMLTDQWFVDTAKIVGPAIEAVRTGASGSCPKRREDLFPLAGEHRALVHLAPALVGPSDPGLVRVRPEAPRFGR